MFSRLKNTVLRTFYCIAHNAPFTK